MVEPLTLQADYPTTDGLSPDAYSLAVISPAYSSPTGELNSALQFLYHYFNFERLRKKSYARELHSIAAADMLHFEILGNAVSALGAQPVFCQNPPTGFNFYSAKYVVYSRNPVNMIEDGLICKKRSVSLYNKMLSRLQNEQLKKIISRILDDEKLHTEKLKDILRELNR